MGNSSACFTYLSTASSTGLLVYLFPCLPIYQPTNLPTTPTNLPIYQPTIYQPTNLPTYQSTNLPFTIYQPPRANMDITFNTYYTYAQ